MKLESLVIANQDVGVNTVNAMGLLVWAGDASGGFRRPRPSLNFVGVSLSLPPSLSMYASLSFRGACDQRMVGMQAVIPGLPKVC